PATGPQGPATMRSLSSTGPSILTMSHELSGDPGSTRGIGGYSQDARGPPSRAKSAALMPLESNWRRAPPTPSPPWHVPAKVQDRSMIDSTVAKLGSSAVGESTVSAVQAEPQVTRPTRSAARMADP